MAKTAEKNRKTPDQADYGHRRKLWRALLLLLVLGLLLLALALAISGARRGLFTSNPRLTLRQIRISVQRDGYWNGKENKLCERIGLAPGINLFAIDYAALRRKLLAVPNIEEAEIIPELPDAVELRLLERVPRAMLGVPGSPWVVDERGVVMPRLESMAAAWPRMPVITGLSTLPLRNGAVAENALPALELIMTALRGFPDIDIRSVSVADPDSLDFWMRYQNQKNCRVIIPRRNRGLSFLLSALQSAIIDAWRHRDPRSCFILSYTGQVLIKERLP